MNELIKMYSHILKRMLSVILTVFITGCSTYHALPLPEQPSYSSASKQVFISTSSLTFPNFGKHKINFQHGWNMTDVAMLAVIGFRGI